MSEPARQRLGAVNATRTETQDVGDSQVVREQPDDGQPHLRTLQARDRALVRRVRCETEAGTVGPAIQDPDELTLRPDLAVLASDVGLLAGQPERMDDVQYVAGVVAVIAEPSVVLG